MSSDSTLVIINGANFVSTYLLTDYLQLDEFARQELFDHLYLMCQFEVSSEHTE